MADLSALNATDGVKIAGADSSGAETNFVNATANGDLKSADILTANVVQTTLSVSVAGAAVEVKVGGSPLANRKSVLIQAQGTNVVYGFASGSQPFQIGNGETISLALGPGVSVWVDRSSGAGSVSVVIAEFA